jgi:hypothetical protein
MPAQYTYFFFRFRGFLSAGSAPVQTAYLVAPIALTLCQARSLHGGGNCAKARDFCTDPRCSRLTSYCRRAGARPDHPINGTGMPGIRPPAPIIFGQDMLGAGGNTQIPRATCPRIVQICRAT